MAGKSRVCTSGRVAARGRRSAVPSSVTAAVRTRRPWLVAWAANVEPSLLAHAALPEVDGPGHRNLAQLLREALDLSAQQRQLAVDPDEGHAPDLLVAPDGVQHDVRLVVLADGRDRRATRSSLSLDEHQSAKTTLAVPSGTGFIPSGSSAATASGGAVKSTAMISPE